MQTVLKVLGVIALVWLAFMVLGVVFSFLGWVLEALFWVLVIGGAAFLGSVAYSALKDKSDRNALNR